MTYEPLTAEQVAAEGGFALRTTHPNYTVDVGMIRAVTRRLTTSRCNRCGATLCEMEDAERVAVGWARYNEQFKRATAIALHRHRCPSLVDTNAPTGPATRSSATSPDDDFAAQPSDRERERSD